VGYAHLLTCSSDGIMSVTSPLPMTALVTGADEGIGYDTARLLSATETCTVVLHASSPERGELTVERLVNNGADPLRLDVYTADFASLGEVARMAHHIAEAHPRLDVVVNAKTTASSDHRILTEDGNEQTLQVNYLAPYLLTRLLEEPLSTARHGRVVNVASTLHLNGNVNWTDLNRTHRFTPLTAYAQSALALIIFTKAIAEYWAIGTTAVSVDPGTADPALLRLHGPWKRPNPDTAQVVARLCSPQTPVLNGGFYDGHLPARTAPCANDRRVIDRLWKLSARMTGLR
jgi:NAD(P)-dependent dehydrogenase (short-subunit alcohol dehydrogenase family)